MIAILPLVGVVIGAGLHLGATLLLENRHDKREKMRLRREAVERVIAAAFRSIEKASKSSTKARELFAEIENWEIASLHTSRAFMVVSHKLLDDVLRWWRSPTEPYRHEELSNSLGILTAAGKYEAEGAELTTELLESILKDFGIDMSEATEK